MTTQRLCRLRTTTEICEVAGVESTKNFLQLGRLENPIWRWQPSWTSTGRQDVKRNVYMKKQSMWGEKNRVWTRNLGFCPILLGFLDLLKFCNRWGKNGNSGRFLFMGSKITMDHDYSHKNYDKPRQRIKQQTSLCQQRSVESRLWLFQYKSWTTKKDEHWRIDAFKLWCWRRLLRVPWTGRRSNQSIRNEINPKYSLGGLMLKL